MKTFLSTGGLGDAYMAFMKIWPHRDEHKYWHHGSSHLHIHEKSIIDLMSLMPNCGYGCIQLRKNVKEVEAKLKKNNKPEDFIRLTSKAEDLPEPYPDLSSIIPKWNSNEYIVLQANAGRYDDSTLRYFTHNAIKKIADNHNGIRKVYLLGNAEDYNIPTHNLINGTGQTSILEAMSIVAGAKKFIGYDGFLAYVAMSFKVPTHILWHMPNLPKHYLHKTWAKTTHQTMCGNIIEADSNLIKYL